MRAISIIRRNSENQRTVFTRLERWGNDEERKRSSSGNNSIKRDALRRVLCLGPAASTEMEAKKICQNDKKEMKSIILGCLCNNASTEQSRVCMCERMSRCVHRTHVTMGCDKKQKIIYTI